MATRSQWVELGREAIIELLNAQHAAPQIEIEARLAEGCWWNGQEIQPRILTLARKDLAATGMIKPIVGSTRGGSKVRLWVPDPIPAGKKRTTEDAAARKRLLIARWRSWSRASTADSMPNLIGRGGETVIHESLRRAAAYGYRLVQPNRGEVTTLFGKSVAGGPLDNAAWLTLLDHQTQAPTGAMYLVLIEVKNIRTWLYPTHAEVYQLLYKAARLTTENPDHPVLPILICRRVHSRTRQMAADLGFMVFQTYAQYVLPNERILPEHFQQVRDEIGLTDLKLSAAPNDALVEWLSGAPQREAAKYTSTWARVGAPLSLLFEVLRRENTPWPDRVHLIEQMHHHVRTTTGDARNWALDVNDHLDDDF